MLASAPSATAPLALLRVLCFSAPTCRARTYFKLFATAPPIVVLLTLLRALYYLTFVHSDLTAPTLCSTPSATATESPATAC